VIKHMKEFGLGIAVLAALLAFPPALRAQDIRPLVAGGADVLPLNTIQVYFGDEYIHGFKSIRTHEPGDLWDHGQLAMRWGVSENVELEVDGSIQKRFQADSGRTDTGVGDFSVWGKFILWRGKKPGTAVGFRLGVKMPNTPSDKDFGTNQTDYYSEFIAGKGFDKLKVWGSVGLGILDNPYKRQSQDDIYTYCLAFSYPIGERWEVTGNGHGFFSGGKPVLYGDNHALSLGVAYHVNRRWEVTASAAKSSGRLYGDWSAQLGVSYRFNV